MKDNLLVDSTVHALIDAPIERIDVSDWLFTLRDHEYQACSRAHIAAAATLTATGKRMSINVEKPGDSLMIQHYVENDANRSLCRVVSRSDVFGPLGQTTWDITWEVSVERSADAHCRFTNHILVHATDQFLEVLNAHSIPFAQARASAQKAAHAHNEEESPLFALDIQGKALAGRWS